MLPEYGLLLWNEAELVTEWSCLSPPSVPNSHMLWPCSSSLPSPASASSAGKPRVLP